MKASTLAHWEHTIRPAMAFLPSDKVVKLYSKGRLNFLKKLKEEIPEETYIPPKSLERICWGIKFRSPIFNAAGMFKNGECAELVYRQGAGAFLGGTTTWNPWLGNIGIVEEEPHIVRLSGIKGEKERLDYLKKGICLPFTPYPRSHSASNCLGLPNDGDEVNSQRAAEIKAKFDFPVGWSLMGSPDLQGEEKLEKLVRGMRLYERAGVDFLEINESCPNTQHGKPQDDDLANRLRYVRTHFLDKRSRRLPVIVKFSNDTQVEQVPALLDLLFELGFDGANFGNTSTAYEARKQAIDPKEHKHYDFFTKTFGGGVSGRPLKESSLALVSKAEEHLRAGPPSQEFHIIRTGGIESARDISSWESAGISLNQWYTGYFENFAHHGHDVYKELYKDLV